MLTLRKGRRVTSTIMLDFDNETVRAGDVIGATQCMVDGCEARAPICYQPSASAKEWAHVLDSQITGFLTGHECDPNRHPGRLAVTQVRVAEPSDQRMNRRLT